MFSPTPKPTPNPTPSPSARPTADPVPAPRVAPGAPTADPVPAPTVAPGAPTAAPIISPTPAPTVHPTKTPTFAPIPSPTPAPTVRPTTTLGPPTSAPTTEAPTAYWDYCADTDSGFDFDGASLLANNLGGAGPDFGDAEELRIGPVATVNGRDVDVAITVASGDYAVASDYADYQGMLGNMGVVNVHDGTTAHLRFSFVDAITNAAVELEKFYLIFVDIDENKKENRHSERLCVDDGEYATYVVNEPTTLVVADGATTCDGGAGGSTTFSSSAAGFECDNPDDPANLGTVTCADCDQCAESGGALDEYFPVEQSERAVLFVFRDRRSSFEMHYEIPCDDPGRKQTSI